MTREEWPTEALRRAVEKVRTAAPRTRHDTLRDQSFAVAPYVRDGSLTAARVEAELLAAAAEAGMVDRMNEATRTIRGGLDKGADLEPWYPDETRAPKPATVRFQGRIYNIETRRPVQPMLGELPAVKASGADLQVTFFGGLNVNQGTRRPLPWGDLVKEAQDPMPWPKEGKAGVPLYSFAVFEDDSRARRPDGLHPDGREKTREPHIECVHALALDIDDDPNWSLDAVRKCWGKVRYLAHTTASHMREKAVAKGEPKPAIPRGRVILPLSRPVLEAEWEPITRWVRARDTSQVGEVELKSPRRPYHVPAAAPGGYSYEANDVDMVLDVDAILREAAATERELQAAIEDALPDQRLLACLPRRRGDLIDSLLTVTRILEDDPRWAGRLRLNEFAGVVELDGQRLKDEDETDAATWIENVYGIRPPTSRVHEAMCAIARRAGYHPLRDELEASRWDGVERLDHWLGDCFGATNAMAPIYAAKWLISAVARIFNPGCKVDTVLILQGGQGAFKSTALRVIGGDYFRDSALSIGDKDGYQQLRGVWIYELAELDSVARRDWSTVKAFLASQVDEYRPSYGRNLVRVPRQVVFAGSTNEATFLGDSTGSRRFWVVECGDIDLEHLRGIRDQLLAEAVVRYRAGEQWWLTPEQEQTRQAEAGAYESTDPWLEAVEGWLATRKETTLAEVAQGAVGRRLEDLNGADEKRLARILPQIGWRRDARVRSDGRRAWRWVRA